MNHQTRQFGAKPDKKDRRDLRTGKSFKLPALSELPDEFRLELPFGIKDQKNSDFCTAFVAAYMNELQEGVEFAPEYNFMASKRISGNPGEWGQYPRDAMKSLVAYGSLPDAESPYDLDEGDDADKIRYPSNWGDGFDRKARPYRKQSYMKATGPYDHFDNIRANIYKFRKKKRAVGFNVPFSYSLGAKKLNHFNDNGGLHNMLFVGWANEDYLISANQYGEDKGEGGFHLVHRRVVNKAVEEYGGHWMVIDRSPESAKKEQWGILQILIDLFRKLWHR